MDALLELLRRDSESPKRIAVIGDAMTDVWVQGEVGTCQEGCLCLRGSTTTSTPGGAANAARQLAHWKSKTWLIAPIPVAPVNWREVNCELAFRTHGTPVKQRYLDASGRVVFRSDYEGDYAYGKNYLAEIRQLALSAIRNMRFDAVLISDYNKGFLDVDCLRQIIGFCGDHDIPCVADACRHPAHYNGAVVKGNHDYAVRHALDDLTAAAVITFGSQPPLILGENPVIAWPPARPVSCVNHVGAGDSFAAHLTLALAHGIALPDAARIAHAAGRVFVQYPHGRPPWPHEIHRDIEPVGGKRLPDRGTLAALRQSNPGRLVFTNGLFRLPHAGHAWLMGWARSQGDVLVVGINDDDSARRLRPRKAILPLEERIALLSGLEAVDWIVPFAEDDPCAVLDELKADVLVKGNEYDGQQIPGADRVKEVLFAPRSPFSAHSSEVATLCRLQEVG